MLKTNLFKTDLKNKINTAPVELLINLGLDKDKDLPIGNPLFY